LRRGSFGDVIDSYPPAALLGKDWPLSPPPPWRYSSGPAFIEVDE
jgi:hypothetical protein